jgi:hypothetical protein
VSETSLFAARSDSATPLQLALRREELALWTGLPSRHQAGQGASGDRAWLAAWDRLIATWPTPWPEEWTAPRRMRASHIRVARAREGWA